MTYEEALKVIEQNLQVAIQDLEGLDPEYEQEQYNALKLAKEALEKQIPKKPVKWCGIWICPTCDYGQDTDRFKPSYCKSCGQHLDWSE